MPDLEAADTCTATKLTLSAPVALVPDGGSSARDTTTSACTRLHVNLITSEWTSKCSE